MEPNDAERVAAILRGGDLAAWAPIYAENVEAMKSKARQMMGGDHAAAEQAVHDAFGKLMKSGLPSNMRSIRAYLLVATESASIDAIRKTGREVPNSEAVETELSQVPGSDDVEDTVLRLMRKDAIAEALNDALHLLSEKERYVIEERVKKGRAAVEVGAEIEVSGSRVNQLVIAALEKLRPFADNRIKNIEDITEDRG